MTGDGWKRLVRPQDLAWLLLFTALALAGPSRGAEELELLAMLGLLQVMEPKIPFLTTPRGNLLSIGIKMVLGFLLIGVTGGITSIYHLILLLPVVSAATTLDLFGTAMVTLIACASYLAFLHPTFLDPEKYTIDSEGLGVIGLRLVFLPVVAFLTNQLAEANRNEARRAQAVAGQLAEANNSLREAEEAVRRSERLAALGQLSAGLAHELRNPMGTMKASAEMLVRSVDGENDVARELAGFVSAEVDRVNSLITRFLEFARPFKLRRKRTDLTEVIDRAVTQLERHNPPYQVTVYKNYSPDIPPFPFDGELMERVIYNLVLNAAQASPPGGAVTLKTRPLAKDRVEISVIDRGSGINPKDFGSIFNPFFTTKTDGVGLGLPIVSKIVDEHGGKLHVESEPQVGSVFRFDVPTSFPESDA